MVRNLLRARIIEPIDSSSRSHDIAATFSESGYFYFFFWSELPLFHHAISDSLRLLVMGICNHYIARIRSKINAARTCWHVSFLNLCLLLPHNITRSHILLPIFSSRKRRGAYWYIRLELADLVQIKSFHFTHF